MNKDFINFGTQEEKVEQLRQERKLRTSDREPSTFHQMANLDLSLGGRFSAGGYVAGSDPTTEYPRLPEGSPWGSGPQVPTEPPLGVSVEVVEPVGTPAEIAASIAELASEVSAPATSSGSLPPAREHLPSPSRTASEAIQRQAHARLAELLPQAIRRRRVT